MVQIGSDGKIQAQNRSHYVCSESHAQFKKLSQWIETKKISLMTILSGGNYIIYGEWLYAKHSINYTNLPDYFVMFDLYDVDTKTFFSRAHLEKLIEGTGICLVPLIYKGKATLEKLKSLVQTKSNFYDGTIEGVYVRSFIGNKLKHRAKIVRADFICGDEHWTKNKPIANTVVKYHG
jgi:atypical dual specificity phosphatase